MEPALLAFRNELLSRLPAESRSRLAPHFSVRRLATGDPVARPGERHGSALFPLSGLTSVVTRMQDGIAAEIWMIGHEGFVGLPLVLGVRESAFEVFQQSAGEALAIDADLFAKELQASAPLRELMLRYAWVCMQDVAISAACSRVHSVEQRYARWLLSSADRVGPAVSLTQEFLAQMLGVRRPTVTLLTSELRRAGIVRSMRGEIRIEDPRALRELSCECYERSRAAFEETMGKRFPDPAAAAPRAAAPRPQA